MRYVLPPCTLDPLNFGPDRRTVPKKGESTLLIDLPRGTWFDHFREALCVVDRRKGGGVGPGRTNDGPEQLRAGLEKGKSNVVRAPFSLPPFPSGAKKGPFPLPRRPKNVLCSLPGKGKALSTHSLFSSPPSPSPPHGQAVTPSSSAEAKGRVQNYQQRKEE